MADHPSASELVRRVLEGLAERTLAFALGTRVAVRVSPAADGVPKGPGGVTVTLTTLAGLKPALWVLPGATWQAWLTGWRSTRPEEADEAAQKALLLLLTGGLDRWQLLSSTNGTPGFPFPGVWNVKDQLGWTRQSGALLWFEIRTPQHQAWVGLSPAMAEIGERLLREPDFRSRLREEVLGEACGRLGAHRDWSPSHRGRLLVKDDFVLGPCLLPVIGSGEAALVPRFISADPNASELPGGQTEFRHTFGWNGETYTVVYRSPDLNNRESRVPALEALAGRLMPFCALVGQSPDREEWETGTGAPLNTQGLLTIEARHVPSGPTWMILIPSGLLGALSVFGSPPWTWTWLSQGADNLLQVFLQVNDRFRLGPPPGFGDRAGLDWTVGWYAQTGQDHPPLAGMTVADLLAGAPPQDRALVVQNILVTSQEVQPLQSLFTWTELDPVTGPTGFQLAGFDRAGFRQLLPPAAREEWDGTGLTDQSREDLRQLNSQALGLVWGAWKQKRLALSPQTVELLREGYCLVEKAWRERQGRERTGAGIGPVLEQLKTRKDLGAVLQRQGPRSLALALLFDDGGSSAVARLCTRHFAEEFSEQKRLWKQTTAELGPELEMFHEALTRLEQELANCAVPPGKPSIV